MFSLDLRLWFFFLAELTGSSVSFHQWQTNCNEDVNPFFVEINTLQFLNGMVFLAKKKTDFHRNGTYQSLHGKTIDLINGWVYGKQFEASRPALKAEMVYSLTSGLKMLLEDRFDFLASNVRNTESIANTLGLMSEIVALSPIIDNENGYLAYCKTERCNSLRVRFDEIFERMRISGELGKLAQYDGVRLP